MCPSQQLFAYQGRQQSFWCKNRYAVWQAQAADGVLAEEVGIEESYRARGGVQLTPFELNVADYEENRHFFLSQYFRSHYDAWMQKLPNLTTGITINRVEVVGNQRDRNTTNTRNIIALTDLGENQKREQPDVGGQRNDGAG